MPITEEQWMPAVRSTWANRCQHDGMKPGGKRRQQALEHYLQGVIAVAYAAGLIDHTRCDQISFLVMCGRGEEFLSVKEAPAQPAAA